MSRNEPGSSPLGIKVSATKTVGGFPELRLLLRRRARAAWFSGIQQADGGKGPRVGLMRADRYGCDHRSAVERVEIRLRVGAGQEGAERRARLESSLVSADVGLGLRYKVRPEQPLLQVRGGGTARGPTSEAIGRGGLCR